MFLSQKVAMEIPCASVSRDAQKKAADTTNLKKKKMSFRNISTIVGGGVSESPHLNSELKSLLGKFVGHTLGCSVLCPEGGEALGQESGDLV